MLRRCFGLFVLLVLCACESKLPHYTPVNELRWMNQNWTLETTAQFYHTPQGTEIMPYAWFLALEQPSFRLNPFDSIPLFSQTAYLAGFGFLPAAASRLNPDALPVGLVKDTQFVDPHSQEARTVLGITCAACHTGQLDVRTPEGQWVGLRVDGGAATLNYLRFQEEWISALTLTEKIPLRFNRFAKRVLGADYNAANKAALKTAFKAFVKTANKDHQYKKKQGIYPHPAGYGRLDAINEIGNRLFASPSSPSNWVPAAAPVDFPPLWETPWYDFVQYNGAVPNPLLRNIGQALGAGAPVVLSGPKENWFRSAVNVENLVALEQWVAGEAPYKGLTAPVWPADILGAVDAEKTARGEKLYAEHCASCHLPAQFVLQADVDTETPVYWTARNNLGQPLLKVTMTEISQVGTDPKQATDFIERKVDASALGLGEINAGAAMGYVMSQVAQRYFRDKNMPEEQQIVAASGHTLEEPGRFLAAYKARPLSGIWATPPFLHNGSVPTLYHLLSPQNERPAQFARGSRVFDPVKVGYDYTPQPHLTLLDTQIPGNRNTGHEFNDGQGPGIVGPKLTETERWDLVEYLKTL
jgi:cytochrome c5